MGVRGVFALVAAAAFLSGCGDAGSSLAGAGGGGGGGTGAAYPSAATHAGGAAVIAPSVTPAPPSAGGGGGVPQAFAVTITFSRLGNLSATTVAGAQCRATAVLPSGTVLNSPQLQQTQVAGSNGAVSWIYSVSTTERGTGTHSLTCTSQGRTQTAIATFPVP